MEWEECIKRNLVEKRSKDIELAKSLLKIAKERLKFFLTKEVSIFTLEGVYEAIIELGHSFLALEGLKTISHECVIEFLRKRYITDFEAEFLHKLRKIRHSIKYYGKILSTEIITKYIKRGRAIFEKLKQALEKKLEAE